MTNTDAHLAVLLRKCQWLLDDAAYQVGGGRMSIDECEALAEALDEMSATVLDYADRLPPPPIVEGDIGSAP